MTGAGKSAHLKGPSRGPGIQCQIVGHGLAPVGDLASSTHFVPAGGSHSTRSHRLGSTKTLPCTASESRHTEAIPVRTRRDTDVPGEDSAQLLFVAESAAPRYIIDSVVGLLEGAPC